MIFVYELLRKEYFCMIFEKMLTPDYTLSAFDELTPEFLRSLGARAVICDIDNTLAPYEVLDAPEKVINWVASLRKADVSLTLVSNNGSKRVSRFNEKLLCNAYCNVKKPSIKYLVAAMADMESSPDETVFLGDQLLTDALAAHRAGVRAVIVPPIKDKKSLLFKFKRAIERPYMKRYNKLKAKNNG